VKRTTDCATLRDRMPDVLHRPGGWTDAEAEHLAACADCQAEWRLVQAASELYGGLVVRGDRIAADVVRRLREPPEPAAQRLPWRGPLLGLVGIAAALALVFGVSWQRQPGETGAPDDSAVQTAVLIPELNGLSEDQLEAVLQALQTSVDDGASGSLPRLGDLDESQLEQLLQAEEG
jgi:hypothetical protein